MIDQVCAVRVDVVHFCDALGRKQWVAVGDPAVAEIAEIGCGGQERQRFRLGQVLLVQPVKQSKAEVATSRFTSEQDLFVAFHNLSRNGFNVV